MSCGSLSSDLSCALCNLVPFAMHLDLQFIWKSPVLVLKISSTLIVALAKPILKPFFFNFWHPRHERVDLFTQRTKFHLQWPWRSLKSGMEKVIFSQKIYLPEVNIKLYSVVVFSVHIVQF